MAGETLIDGFNDASAGMDASRSAEVIDPRSFALGVNITARNGMPATRPMWRRVEFAFPSDRIRGDLFQGSLAYYNPVTRVRAILAVFAGRVYSFDPIAATWRDLSADSNLVNDTTAPHYFCLAESFLVINNGKDGALIFDGAKLRRAGPDEVPTGTIMAYGQGRLFVVSPDFRAIQAGDLIYGGSTASSDIFLAEAGSPTRITTKTPHNLATNDTVTIERNYATPSIVGTWTVTVLNATQFTIPQAVTLGGGGGAVKKANSGLESDVLRFTETKFLNERGIFRLPVWMGRIRSAVFFPVQDTGAGQGDLLVGGEYGACSFLVSQPRETWLNIPIQRVALTDIGFGGPLAVAQVNGDVFFASQDGLRSYRNARAEFGQYGNTPLSAEIDPALSGRSLPSLAATSMALHDNRLLYTVNAHLLPSNDVNRPPRYVFQSLAALDFQQSSRISKSAMAAYDGVWTGLDFAQLVPAAFAERKRLYAWCWQKQDPIAYTPDPVYQYGPRANELWEITTETTGYDQFRICTDGNQISRQQIISAVELRSMDFSQWKDEKKLTRLDMWMEDIRSFVPEGDIVGPDQTAPNMSVYWRPDVSTGGWFFWGDVSPTPGTCAYEAPGAPGCDEQPQIRPPFHVSPYAMGKPPDYTDPMTKRRAEQGCSFQLRLQWTGRLRIKKLLAYSETPPQPRQGDRGARSLADTSTYSEYPKLFPVLGASSSYAIISPAACRFTPCVNFSTINTTPPAYLLLKFTTDPAGPAPVQFAAAEIRQADLVTAGSYSINVPNGFSEATIFVDVMALDDPDFAAFGIAPQPAVKVRIAPDNNHQETSWLAVVPVSACFDQPLPVTLGANFLVAI